MLCNVLNKLIWKCPTPTHLEGLHEWAEYWLGELRDGPDECRIEGIEWDRKAAAFRPIADGSS